jgi:hypothetical protein
MTSELERIHNNTFYINSLIYQKGQCRDSLQNEY